MSKNCTERCPRKLFDYKPERLVIGGLRCCMAGYDYGDCQCWDLLWAMFLQETGPADSRGSWANCNTG